MANCGDIKVEIKKVEEVPGVIPPTSGHKWVLLLDGRPWTFGRTRKWLVDNTEHAVEGSL